MKEIKKTKVKEMRVME